MATATTDGIALPEAIAGSMSFKNVTGTDDADEGRPWCSPARRCRTVSIAVCIVRAWGLGLGVLRLAALVEEGRQRDRGKNADDHNDDQKLDEGETLLTLSALTKLVEACG